MDDINTRTRLLPKRMLALDGLRGVAALIVLFNHSNMVAPRNILVVGFFFMLSGFVLAHAYQEKLTNGMSFRGFARVRAIRLYPMIVAATLLSVAVRFVFDGRFHIDMAWTTATLAALAGLPSSSIPHEVGNFPLNPPEWSLFYELALSALFGIMLYRLTLRRVAMIAAVATAGYMAVEAIYQTEDVPTWARSFNALAAFCIGVLLLGLVAGSRVRCRNMPLAVMAAVLAAVTFVPLSVGWWFNIAAVTAIFPVLILGGVYSRSAGWFTRFLGDISYPLYIVHWPILVAADAVLPHRIGSAATQIAVCIFSVAGSWLALKIFDEPARAWLTKINAPTIRTGAVR
jgi:peptidoglycan/LPS O-acetylase OafA/YrhL